MAKGTKPTEEVVEQSPEAAPAKETKAKATSKEYTLKPGEVYLEMKDNPEEYLITTRQNWDKIYSKGDAFVLKDEKKR